MAAMEESRIPARAGAPRPLRLRSVRWERIQLVLEFDDHIPPLALRPGSGSAHVPPTRQWAAGDRTLVRFNVLQGPDLQPLEPGRWTLVGPDGRPVRVDLDPSVANEGGTLTQRSLSLPRSSYQVRCRVEGSPSSLVLDTWIGDAMVTIEPKGIRKRLGVIWRRFRRIVWRRAFSLLRHLVRRRKAVVLFATRLTPRLSGNLKVVHDRMVERGFDSWYELATITKPAVDRPLSWRDRFKLFVSLARAEVIFLDDSFYPVYGLDFPEHVRVVQLWHASGAFKTVGYSRAAVGGAPPFDPFGNTHKNTTHVIVSSDFDVPFYAEALGVPEARVYPTGIPRMDRFWDPVARDRAVEAAKTAIPAIVGRKVWLFAPTYRGDKVSEATYDLGRLDLEALHRIAAAKDAVVVFKMHPFVRERLDLRPELADRLIEASDLDMDVNDLLFSVDLLITDYSSIVFEFSVLNRPMLFFAYDLGDYGSDRDFYVPFAEFVPGRIVRTFDELADALEREDFEFEKVGAFAHKHFAHLDGTSTDRVIDLVLQR
jgi:CDP-glycerol glycerophosphotransferase (TagB/SpsB family)